MDIVKFEFNGTAVDFEPTGKDNVMVNATQMAKIFGKEIKQFNELESTKKFINSCLNGRESRPLGIEKKQDLIISNPKTGTWMHRILALKFAAWLDPDFDVWVYCTIDKLLFGDVYEKKSMVKEMALLNNEYSTLEKELQNDPRYKRMKEIKQGVTKIDKGLKRIFKEDITQQLSLFTEE